MPPTLLIRSVLLAPNPVVRAASAAVHEPEQRWMLTQPRPIRASYVREVLDPGEDARRQQAWMLRQAPGVRESFIAGVLERLEPVPLEQVWMLRQPDRVRQSFIRDVLEARDGDG